MGTVAHAGLRGLDGPLILMRLRPLLLAVLVGLLGGGRDLGQGPAHCRPGLVVDSGLRRCGDVAPCRCLATTGALGTLGALGLLRVLLGLLLTPAGGLLLTVLASARTPATA